jgi:hypothetical protein
LLSKDDELYSTTIFFRKTDFYFQMRPNAYDESCLVMYSPALTKYKFESRIAGDNWDDIRQQFEIWINSLKGEISLKDKWVSFKGSRLPRVNTFKFW